MDDAIQFVKSIVWMTPIHAIDKILPPRVPANGPSLLSWLARDLRRRSLEELIMARHWRLFNLLWVKLWSRLKPSGSLKAPDRIARLWLSNELEELVSLAELKN